MHRTEGEFYFGGAGARDTPDDVQREMEVIARHLTHQKGGILRSGGQPLGADGAWWRGAERMAQIFKPRTWQRPGDYFILDEAYEIAARHHPHWKTMYDSTKDKMARNVHIVLGPDLKDPSEYLLVWTKDGVYDAKDRVIGKNGTGGTGHTIAVACEAGVPVFNLNNKQHHQFIHDVLIK